MAGSARRACAALLLLSTLAQAAFLDGTRRQRWGDAGAASAPQQASAFAAKKAGRRAWTDVRGQRLMSDDEGAASAPQQASAFAARKAGRRAWTDVRGQRLMSDDEVWAAMRHLYPGAPVKRPRSRGGLSAEAAAFALGRASKGSRLLRRRRNGLAAGQAAVTADIACSYYFTNGRSISWSQQQDFWKKWPELDSVNKFWGGGVRPEVALDEMNRSVTVTSKQMLSTFKYVGPQFGCVQVEQRSAVDGRVPGAWAKATADGRFGAPERAKSFLESAHDIPNGGDEWGGVEQGRAPPPPAADLLLHGFADEAIAFRGTSAVGVWYKGMLIERYAKALNVSQSTKLHGWSLAKGILSLLFGARNRQIPERFHEEALAKVPELRRSEVTARGMTLGNLLNMRVGKALKENDPKGLEILYGTPDAAKCAATAEPSSDSRPAGSFVYSSPWALLLSRELRLSFPEGEDGATEYAEYPWVALFRKLNASFACDTDPAGTFLLSGFCHGTLRDWLKIGLLVMNQGRWNGEEVIPADWIERSTRPLDIHDNACFYTHLWYRMDIPLGLRTPVIAARGAFGQELIIVPELDFVLVRTGATFSNILKDWDLEVNDLVPLLNGLSALEHGMH